MSIISADLRKYKNSYNIIVEKGFYLRSNGKYKDAIIEFKKAQLTSPEKYKAYWEAGWAYSLMGKYADAVKEYESAYIIDTTNLLLKEQIKLLKKRYSIK